MLFKKINSLSELFQSALSDVHITIFVHNVDHCCKYSAFLVFVFSNVLCLTLSLHSSVADHVLRKPKALPQRMALHPLMNCVTSVR
jgi:hypothetical protein